MDTDERRPGVKTSVYLPADVAEDWRASGASLTELVRDGLAYRARLRTDEDTLRRVMREELVKALAEDHPICAYPRPFR